MRRYREWTDYRLIDATDGFRLESWAGVVLVRPDPQVIWKSGKNSPLWDSPHAVYHRSKSGGGHWEYLKKVPRKWNISWEDLVFSVSPTGFKHTGLFPEQAVNWREYRRKIREAGMPLKILNLFGYTGGATLACARACARVCHVDASKGMVTWARENAALSGLSRASVRWIVDDCIKFVKRELRRGSKYDGIIMDPPSYGRGPGGEVWKFRDDIRDLVKMCSGLLSEDPVFVAVNSYTQGVSAGTVGYMLENILKGKYGGIVQSYETGLQVESTGLVMPCGNTALWEKEDY